MKRSYRRSGLFTVLLCASFYFFITNPQLRDTKRRAENFHEPQSYLDDDQTGNYSRNKNFLSEMLVESFVQAISRQNELKIQSLLTLIFSTIGLLKTYTNKMRSRN